MSVGGPLSQAVWRSDLPKFLQWGVAGKLAALADKSGGQFFPGAITINYLASLRYGKDNHRLCKQTIKYQVHALQRCGFLEIVGVGGARGHARAYFPHPEVLATVRADDPIFRAPHRRNGAAPEGRILTRRYPTGAEKGDNKGDNTAEPRVFPPKNAPIGHERSTHAPPNLAGPIGRSPRRRWDAVRTPAENFAVFTKLVDTLCDEVLAAGKADLPEGDFVEHFKARVASLMPGQAQNTAQIMTALDAAAYRRRMLGKPLPANIGSNGQTAFMLHRQQHARMDAR